MACPRGGRAGAAGCEAAEAVRKAESKSVDLRRAAADVNSLARLEPIDQVGGLDATCGGQSTDTAFLFSNGAEGGVAVEPEVVFPVWRSARRECLPGGTQ